MDPVIVLETSSLRVEPGSEASTNVRVRNGGLIVDEFLLEVLGVPGGWITVEPSTVSLFPGAEGTAKVRFQPARIPASRAGRIAFGVKATSRTDPTQSAVEEGTVDVLPYRDEGLELVPRTSHGWRGATHEAAFRNGGNTPVKATISASDPDRLLQFDVRPSELTVEPATSRTARIRVTPTDAPLMGAPTRLPFVVSADTGGGTPIVIDAAFERRAPLPAWLVAALAGLIGLAVIGVVVAMAIGPGGPTPPPVAVTPTPAASTPTVAVTDQPATPEPTQPTEPPEPTPTLEPTPEPLACGNVFTTDATFNLGSSSPTVLVDRPACLLRLGMFTPGSGSGPIRLTLDGVDFFRFDLAEMQTIGQEGAGSGEREVTLEPAVPAREGQTIGFDESGCEGDGCGQFVFWISAANAP